MNGVQLTVVLLREEGSRCRGKKLPQIWDLSHNVNSTKSSLEEQSSEPLRQDLHLSSVLTQDWIVPNLLLHVGVGRPEQPLNLGSQISAHLGRTHAGQRAQSQRLYVLVTVREVTGAHTDNNQTPWNFQQQKLLGFIVIAHKPIQH